MMFAYNVSNLCLTLAVFKYMVKLELCPRVAIDLIMVVPEDIVSKRADILELSYVDEHS
jgi:hypothetical protein